MNKFINIIFSVFIFSCGFGTTIPGLKMDIFIDQLEFYNSFLTVDFDPNTYVYTLLTDENSSFSLDAKSNFSLAKIVVNETKVSKKNSFSVELSPEEILNNSFTIKVSTGIGNDENKYTFNIKRKRFVFLEKIKVFFPNEPEKEITNLAINGLTVYPDLITYDNIEIQPIVSEEKMNLVDIYVDGVLLEDKANIPIIGIENFVKIEIKAKPGLFVEEVFYNLKFEKTTDFSVLDSWIEYLGFSPDDPRTKVNTTYHFPIDTNWSLGPYYVHDYETTHVNFFIETLNKNVKFKYLDAVYGQSEAIPLDISELFGTNDIKEFMIEAFMPGSSNSKKVYRVRVLKYSNMFLDQLFLKDAVAPFGKFFTEGDGTYSIKDINHSVPSGNVCKLADLFFSPRFEVSQTPLNFIFDRDGTFITPIRVDDSYCLGQACYKVPLDAVCPFETFIIKVRYKDIVNMQLIYKIMITT